MSFNFFNRKETKQETANQNTSKESAADSSKNGEGILMLQNILIGKESVDKEAAIEAVGQLLVDSGYVMPDYIHAMKEREKVLTTYIGNGIAIPHGVGAAKDKILKSGIAIIQYPNGVSFGDGKTAHMVVGIAGKGNEHMKILTNLAEFIQEEQVVKELFSTKDANKIYSAFTSQI